MVVNDSPTLIFHTGIAKTSSELEGLDAVQAQTQESGEIFGGVAFILAASVFSKSYVKLPVATIFDAPVITSSGNHFRYPSGYVWRSNTVLQKRSCYW